MEQRFTSLLNRFDTWQQTHGDSQPSGNAQVSDAMLDRFESILNKLEGGNAGSQPAAASSQPVAAAASSGPGKDFVVSFKEACFKNVPALLEVTKE